MYVYTLQGAGPLFRTYSSLRHALALAFPELPFLSGTRILKVLPSPRLPTTTTTAPSASVTNAMRSATKDNGSKPGQVVAHPTHPPPQRPQQQRVQDASGSTPAVRPPTAVRERGGWKDLQRCRAFFDSVAVEQGFDARDPKRWYALDVYTVKSRSVRCVSTMLPHQGSGD